MSSLEGNPIDQLDEVLLEPVGRRGYADFDYPWPAPAVPTAAALEADARAWAVRFGLVQVAELPRRFDPVNVGLLTALSYPGAPAKRQHLIAELLAWIFIQDDVYDDAVASHDPELLHTVLSEYVAVLRGAEPGPRAGAASVALASLRDRINAVADPAWMDWFCESMRGFWLEGIVAETRIRSLDITPDVTTYLRMRVHSIGVLPFLDLVELAHGFALPRVVCGDPTMMKLRLRTARIIAYANDVFSYEKERRAGDPNNLVHVLRHHDGYSIAGAVDRVVRLHDRELELFRREAASTPFAGIPHVGDFLEGHRAWMRGALDWQRMSRRYTTGRELLDQGAQ